MFKSAEVERQYKLSPSVLRAIAEYFEELSLGYGVEPYVTRAWDRVSPNESGVHIERRALDFRSQRGSSGVPLYSGVQIESIVKAINKRYPREDDKQTCIYHSFQGGPWHFHIQIPYAWLTYAERHQIKEGIGNGTVFT